jgi:hypothetical protein
VPSRETQLITVASAEEIFHVASRDDVEWLRQLERFVLMEDDRRTKIVPQLAMATIHSEREMLHYHHENFLHAGNSTTSGNWSPIQVLAKSHVIGAQKAFKASHYYWKQLPLTVRVLVGFRASRDRDFAVAQQILDLDLESVKDEYGTRSTEFLVVGTQLMICYNALSLEGNAEILANDVAIMIWPDRKTHSISRSDVTRVRSTQDIYLLIAYSDSMIGRGMYDTAKELLYDLAHHHITNNIIKLQCMLRILKIIRRQQAQDSASNGWTLLQKAIGLLDNAPSDLLYQCFEEATCMLSTVNSLDTAQIAIAKDVVDALDSIDISRFQGSNTMKLTLQDYRHELKVYRKDLGLFSVTGPQLHYCRNIREGFPRASIAFIERIGSANWERYRRLKEMPHTDEAAEPVATVDPSRFHDSGIGSSLETSTHPAIINPPKSRASRLSMSTASGPGLSSLLNIPQELVAGKPYECEWCGRYVKFDYPKQQWP